MDVNTQSCKEIAPRLRGLRDALGLSLDEMAGDLEVSAADVESYEGGAAEIPVSYLFHVAQKYGVDLTVLISGKESHLHGFSLVKQGRGMSVERRKDYDYKSLAYRFVGRRMEPFLVTVPPREGHEATFNEHPGQEFIFGLEGRLEVVLGERVVVVEPGDSLYFTSRTPHSLRGLDGRPAVFLDVII
ncbi:MAG: cupin domain-containing protein [Deltaproteobacteria bacterium]|nr:cupin domain-containing protein [Deltaproteobacteria bacterium]